MRQCVPRDGRRETEPHAPVVLKPQAVGVLPIVADLVMAGADNDRLFVVDLVLIDVFHAPEAEVLGAVEALDEESGIDGLEPAHEFDSRAPALVAPLPGGMPVRLVVAVEPRAEARVPAPVGETIFPDRVVLHAEPPLVVVVAGEAVVGAPSARRVGLLPLRFVGPEGEAARIPLVAVGSAAHVEAIRDALGPRMIGHLAGRLRRIVGDHVPVRPVCIRLRVGVERLEDDHVAIDFGERVDRFCEKVLVFIRAGHLREGMEELVVDVEESLLAGPEIVEGVAAHGPHFVAIQRLVAGAVGVVAEGPAAVFDHHARLPVDAHELRFARIAFAGPQDETRLKGKRHRLPP